MDIKDKQARFKELLKKKGIIVPGGRGPVLEKSAQPGPFPLSFAQRRIWFLQQFDRESGAYNDPTALRLRGPLDTGLLERTLNEIIRRHQVLRMVFPAREGQPEMAPHPEDRISITVTGPSKDAVTIPGDTSPGDAGGVDETDVVAFVNSFSRLPFDLSRELPIRAAVLKAGPEDYVLVVNIHHIVMDGWSKGIMLRELMSLYEAFSEERPPSLPEPPVQYSDYVRWQHEWARGQGMQSQLDYWKERLTGAPPLLELPTDHPRPGIPAGGGSIEPFSLSRRLRTGVERLAKEQDVTPFMVLLAVYSLLLNRCSGREDIIVGSPIAGRGRLELEGLIGLFVNTLVMRTGLSGEPGFSGLLKRVKQTALGAFDNQDIPFEKLVEVLNPQRDLNITPIFQVMFQLQNAPMPPARIAGLSIAPLQIDTGFAQVDLSLTMWEEEGSMKGTFEYSTDLFEAPTIRRMARHFLTLLEAAAEAPHEPASRLDMLTGEERRRILVEWNDTQCDVPEELNIYQLLEGCAEKYPGEEAVVFESQRLTYRQLEQRAAAVAGFLKQEGIGPGMLVAICMENSLQLITGITGILKAGAGYIPLDPEYPDQRLRRIIRDASPSLLFTNRENLHRFSGCETVLHSLEEEGELFSNGTGASGGAGGPGCKPGDVGCVIYTSGSSGDPRGIMLENRGIVNLISSFIQSYRPGPGDRVLPLTSIASASFVGEILPVLSSGGGIVLAHKAHFLDMKTLTAFLDRQAITILSTVPSMLARLNAVDWKPGKLRLLLSGGEALSAGDIDRLTGNAVVVNGYGLSEATICSTYINIDEKAPGFDSNPVISVGRPIINTQVHIRDAYGNLQPVGVPGEMYIAGHGLARGYLNDPEKTMERFITLDGQRVLKTGDLGSWFPDGTIKFLGRIDSQVQLHGHRIELSEIETWLGLHPAVAETALLAREIAPGDKRLVAYLVPREGQETGAGSLREWLSSRVPDYMIPAFFESVPSIPLTVNGKVDAAALPMPSGARPDLDTRFKAPRTEIEQTIASIWLEYLHLEEVGIHDNFFDLGGHSLLLTQLLSRLNETYRKDLTIMDMFRYPTVYLLAGYISRGDETGAREQEFQKIQERAGKLREARKRRAPRPPHRRNR